MSLELLNKFLEKQVGTQEIAVARQKGLVPKTGDWEKPGRWIKPKDNKQLIEEKGSIFHIHDMFLSHPKEVKNHKKFFNDVEKVGSEAYYVMKPAAPERYQNLMKQAVDYWNNFHGTTIKYPYLTWEDHSRGRSYPVDSDGWQLYHFPSIIYVGGGSDEDKRSATILHELAHYIAESIGHYKDVDIKDIDYNSLVHGEEWRKIIKDLYRAFGIKEVIGRY